MAPTGRCGGPIRSEDLAVVFMAQVPGEQRRSYRPLINALVYQALME